MNQKKKGKVVNDGIPSGKSLTELNEEKKRMDAAWNKRMGYK